MQNNIFGKKLSRSSNERRRLLQSLARELIIRDQIKTTHAKAKALQPLVEKIITNAKKQTSAGEIKLRSILCDKRASQIVIQEAQSRFKDRQGGYTQIFKLGRRSSDNSEVSLIKFVDIRAKPPKDQTNAPVANSLPKYVGFPQDPCKS